MPFQLRRFLVLFFSLVFLAACVSTDDSDESSNQEPERIQQNDSEGGPHAVPELDFGKADNFIGTNAREFILIGEFSAEIPSEYHDAEDEDAKEEILFDAVSDQLTNIGHSIERHISSVVSEHNRDLTDEQQEFFTYFRSDSTTRTDAEVDGDSVNYEFEMEFVGSVYLMSIIAPDDAVRRTFEVPIYSSRWGGSVEDHMEIEIQGSPSRDAFPSYDKLFENGFLDIAIHFGGDYNTERLDIETVEWTVGALLEDNWHHDSVTSFEELRIDSGPFTRQLIVEGEPLEVRISLFHAEMKDDEVDDERVGHEGLREAVEYSLEHADIFVYSGHAGTNAGFILDYGPRYEIPADDFASMDMSDDYQIYVMDGCNTYRTYVQDLMDNPSRNFANTDIMTTVHTTPFSAGYHVIWQLMYWFTFTDQAGNHFPLSWQTMIRGLNQDFPDVHYGVHGVDDAPKLNPHGGEGLMCRPCSSDADCGGGGNYCLGFEGGAGCSVGCTTDTACGSGFRCARIFDIEDQFYIPKQCVPVSNSCAP